ncbi:hypothetical protein NVP1101O_171 [Vibrio phage 1.101.O._10N.261.45.C6]|nr:hypothetical protein NVP1101O_171 [Vibrio phage 1.101.O._10N.261.45.C6]
MVQEVYRVEVDLPSGSYGMFLAEFYTENEDIKKACQHYRSKAPYMPEPEHPLFESGIPYCIQFGCNSPQQLMSWFGWSKVLLKETLKHFKLRKYQVYNSYDCEEQVGFDLESSKLVEELDFETFNKLLRKT